MNAPFAWPGGKRALRSTLLSLIPEHEIYVEVFAGSAKLLFAKEPSRLEVINDLNGDLINFFRVAKHRPAELAERLELEIVHAQRFKDLRALELRESASSEVERALQFAYLVWYSYGSKGEHFASPSSKSPRPPRPLDRVRELLHASAKRLSSVLVEQRDFMAILDRYDSERTFFYLDPPYVHYQANGRYQPLTRERREQLFDRLEKVEGKFLMSFDDCEEVRNLSVARQLKLQKVKVRYTLSNAPGSRSRTAPEVLISNYSTT